jgi:phytoene dehydrogenase-like protein
VILIQPNAAVPAAAVLGKIGLPMPVRELAARRWDVIVVGAGHNSLTCAAYLARAGKRVLVLEARERVGGACTLEEPWPGVRMSPCAYVSGLLHPLVIRELDMARRGYDFTPALNGLFVPFEDRSSVQLYDAFPERCAEEIRRLSPPDVDGYRAMQELFERCNAVVRADADDGMWVGEPPSRAAIEERLGDDAEARGLLFDWSIAELLAYFFRDERLQMAYMGQGVIGSRASPFDPGTASIYYYHYCSSQGGYAGMWGYVRGGMGMVSFILCDAARDAGAVVAAGVPVARILPGEGVALESGEHIGAPIIVSGADPRVTLGLLGPAADASWSAQVAALPIEGATVKLSVLLHELPNFIARPGIHEPHHLATIDTPLTLNQWRTSHAAMMRGELPEQLWTELYFQTAHDTGVAPAGLHTMSVFAQYVPYQFAQGDWDSRRLDVRRVAINSIARFCNNLPDAVIDVEVLGPPDIARKVGLTGGHIFQGEILPDYMWEQRLGYRTPMEGVYLCGACTHPGGGVVAINGRNAAMAILHKQ